jgi:hypothetical protein
LMWVKTFHRQWRVLVKDLSYKIRLAPIYS